jgi:hypothetical protein
MVPQVIHIKPALPRTPNGKIDVTTLTAEAAAAVNADADAGSTQALPIDELEAQLLTIWRDVVRAKEIGIDDNVFLLGGNSLTAARLVSRVRVAAGVSVQVRDIFNFPTPRKLAARIRSLKHDIAAASVN